MKCTNCSNEVDPNSKFCTNCGSLVPEVVVEAPAKPAAEPQAAPVPRPVSVPTNKEETSSFNGKILIPVAIIAVLIIGLFILLPKSGGNKPAKVVYSFLESVDKVDTEKFLNAFSAEAVDELLYYTNYDMLELSEDLHETKEALSYELGPNWLREFQITVVYEDDLRALVSISARGESKNIPLIKESNKWKIDDVSTF